MTETREKLSGLTRRSFLKTSAAVAGTAALSGIFGCSLGASDQATDSGLAKEEIFYGICRGNCEGACRHKITVRDNKVVKVTMAEYPNPEYNRICAKGLSHLQWIYNTERIKAPLRRVGERGSGEWEQISWNEAYDEIANKWQGIIRDYGSNSIVFSCGTGNSGYGNRMSNKLVALIGASNVHMSYDMAFNYGSENALGIGNGWNINEPSYFHKTRCFIVWGANVSEAHPHYWHFILESKQAGAKMIVIDPNYTITASKADLHVPIRPATDAALYMCLTNLAIQNDVHDKEFIKKMTVGPFLVKDSDGKYLRMSDLGVEPQEGPINPSTGQPTLIDPIAVLAKDEKTTGLIAEIEDPVIEGRYVLNGNKVTTAFTLLKERCAEWTLSRTSELCGISEEVILKIHKTMIENSPVVAFQGFGPDHYLNGHYPYFAMQALLATTGNLAKDGASGGNGFAWDNAFRMVTYAINTLPPQYRAGPTITTTMLAETIETEKINGETPLKIKSVYFWNHNPVGNIPDRKATLAAFNKLDFIIVVDPVMTDTARYADLVLPSAHCYEQLDMFIAGSPFATLSEKAIEPLYESKSDYDILCEIGHKMGFAEHFQMSIEEFLKEHWSRGIGKLTWDDFLREKTIWGPVKRNGIDTPPMTATQRFQFYRETISPNVNIGQKLTEEDIKKERLPYFEPPNEAWPETVGGFTKNPLADTYPLIYTSERSKLKTHSMFGFNPWLLEIIPEPIIKISTKDAQARGIETGDYVRVFNDRGYVVVKGVVNDGIRPGMVVIPKGWQEGQFKEGHYNDLTSRINHKVCLNNNYFDALCQVEKV